MEHEKIKLLRKEISISLNMAIQLLNINNGNIAACVEEFHNDNLEEICRIAECNKNLAKEYYEACNFNTVKAIKKICSIPIIITTRENPKPKNEIGFILWPEKENGENYKTAKRNDAFIPTFDFDLIIKEFKSVYPLINPKNNEVEECFDTRGHNFIDAETCKIIVAKIAKIKSDDVKTKKFIEQVINWLNDKLEYALYIVVYGNL